MPRSQKGHKFILCIFDGMTNYLITVPIYHSRSEEVGEALVEHVISKYCAPDFIIMDQDSAFKSTYLCILIQEIKYKDQDHGPIQSSIFTSRTQYQIVV